MKEIFEADDFLPLVVFIKDDLVVDNEARSLMHHAALIANAKFARLLKFIEDIEKPGATK